MAIKTLNDVTINVLFNKETNPAFTESESGDKLEKIVKDTNSSLRYLNNGKSGKSTVVSATITSTWTGTARPYTQTINIEGVTATNIVEISLDSNATDAQANEYMLLSLQDGGQGAGYITLKSFGAKNTADIPIVVVIRADT